MRDGYGRVIDYLRVSVTDFCNLRCRYCMPGDVKQLDRERVLRFDEIERLTRIFAGLGVGTVRVTGGEPLMRRGLVELLESLRRVPGVRRLCMTTNAVALAPHVARLSALPLDSLNVSLDTLDRDAFRRLTGFDALVGVLRAINAALDAGLHVKLNCVPVRGVNDHELMRIAALAEARPVDVRFIELMPIGPATAFERVPGGDVLRSLAARYPDLAPDGPEGGAGPARYYKSARLRGRIGLIDAMSGRFCARCNRVRLSSEGMLRLCLDGSGGADLRALLRGGAEDGEIEGAIERAVLSKPAGHMFHEEAARLAGMSSIGG